jgi:hypothetical protein
MPERFLEAFTEVRVAGFHTYGETWLGHVNQTLTGVVSVDLPQLRSGL